MESDWHLTVNQSKQDIKFILRSIRFIQRNRADIFSLLYFACKSENEYANIIYQYYILLVFINCCGL